MIVGDYRGRVWLYLNNGSGKNPVLKSAGRISADGVEIDVGGFAAPVVADWNSDGKKDLIVGSARENIHVFINTGRNDDPVFKSSFIVANVRHNDSHPEFVDMNGDGKKDLLVGENEGYVYFYPNRGSESNPAFSDRQRLLLKVNAFARIEVADWGADGQLDLLVGSEEGYINIYSDLSIISDIKNPVVSAASQFRLFQNYPNPFGGSHPFWGNPGTTIRYALPALSDVRIEIYNASGKLIRNLFSGVRPSGEHTLFWDGLNEHGKPAASGIYIYKLFTTQNVVSRKMLLLR